MALFRAGPICTKPIRSRSGPCQRNLYGLSAEPLSDERDVMSDPANAPELYIDLPKTAYAPGETITGRILWALDHSPKKLELTAGWWTEGRGTKDFRIEATVEWNTDASAGEESFTVQLPLAPYSFSGTLISLQWMLELREHRHEKFVTEPIVVSPSGEPVLLPRIDEGERKSFSILRDR